MKNFVSILLIAVFFCACANQPKVDSVAMAVAPTPLPAPISSPVSVPANSKTSTGVYPEKEMAEIQKRVLDKVSQWVLPAQEILQRTNDGDASLYVHAFNNCPVQIPLDKGSELGLLGVTTLERPSEPWVDFILVEDVNVSPVWKRAITSKDFLASYDFEQNTVIIHDFRIKGIPKIMKGLVMLHEMRHWKQANFDFRPDPRFEKQMQEIDAYEYEFSLLDRLNLPGYSELVAHEKNRLRSDYFSGKPVNPVCPVALLKKVFPDLGNETDTVKAAQSEVFLLSLFKIIDEGPEREREARKIKLMSQIYK